MQTDLYYMNWHMDYFNKWLYNSMCDNWQIYGYFKNSSECQKFGSEIPKQGYYSLLFEYVYLITSVAPKLKPPTIESTYNSEDWINLRVMAKYIFHAKNIDYMEYIIDSVADITRNANYFILWIALAFIFLLLTLFLIIWIPFMLTLQKEIVRTNAMLLLIPTEVYMGNRYLREAFEKKALSLTQIN